MTRQATKAAADIADSLDSDGVLALAFPLHPPGRPERSRADELAGAGAGAPVLVVQGGRDPFGTPAEVTADVPGARVVAVPGADHGFAVPVRSGVCTRTEALELVAGAVLRSLAEWCAEGGR